MTASVIEQAARALCRLDGRPENIMTDGRPMWEGYVGSVRAVLGALREPSDGMKEAGAIAARRNDVDFRLDDRQPYTDLDALHRAEGREEAGVTFTGMIDAALAERG